MKLRIPQTILIAAAALVFGSAAYAQEINVRVRVPFDFVVADKVYPAGEYAVQTAKDNTFYLSVKNEDKTMQGLTPSYPCISSKPGDDPANQAKLVFHRMANTYFLFRVWSGGNTVGREFPVSRRETQMAMNGLRSETVIVAANMAH